MDFTILKYKRLSKRTENEKQLIKWIKKGCPVLFWDSSKKGTYIISKQGE